MIERVLLFFRRMTDVVPPNPLTLDARRAALAELLSCFVDVMPTSKEELQWYVETFYGYRIPDVAVCDGHCSPLDALWDAFTDVTTNTIWIGPRTGGKTLQFAILDHLCMKFHADTIANVGAVEEQAKKCYSYFQKFSDLPHFKAELMKAPMLSKTFFRNGAQLEILPATMNRVNSPHPRRAHWDEIELTTQAILNEGKSMPVRTNGRPPAQIFTSSRKKAFGPMEDMLKTAAEAGRDVYKWCVFEIIEKCPEERHQNGAGCETCPLKNICKEQVYDQEFGGKKFVEGPGRAARANGWMKIEDVIQKYRDISWDVFRSQWLSERPETAGLVYPMFNVDVHVIDYEISQNFPIACGIDFGFINPSVQVAVQHRPDNTLVICDEIYVRGVLDDAFADLIKQKPWFRKDQARIADSADPAAIQTLNDHGVPCEAADKSQAKGQSSVVNGINLVRWLLEPQGSPKPYLYVARHCVNTIDEFLTYHHPDVKEHIDPEEKPQKQRDHAMDALRYVLAWLFRSWGV